MSGSYLELFKVCDQGSGRHPGETQMPCLNFEVAREERSTSLCGPVKGVPREDKAEQELSRLPPFEWQLC